MSLEPCGRIKGSAPNNFSLCLSLSFSTLFVLLHICIVSSSEPHPHSSDPRSDSWSLCSCPQWCLSESPVTKQLCKWNLWPISIRRRHYSWTQSTKRSSIRYWWIRATSLFPIPNDRITLEQDDLLIPSWVIIQFLFSYNYSSWLFCRVFCQSHRIHTLLSSSEAQLWEKSARWNYRVGLHSHSSFVSDLEGTDLLDTWECILSFPCTLSSLLWDRLAL